MSGRKSLLKGKVSGDEGKVSGDEGKALHEYEDLLRAS